MDFSFIELKELLLVAHLIGLALGVGGALISDAMFFRSIRDYRISRAEMGFLMLGSWSVMAGLGLLIVSGLGMFSLDAERYLASSKFIAKMTVVGVLVVNGVLLHRLQIPYLREIARGGYSTRTRFARTRSLFLVGGVVSIVSWLTALVLGAFGPIPWPVAGILGAYALALVAGCTIAFLLRDVLIPVVPRAGFKTPPS